MILIYFGELIGILAIISASDGHDQKIFTFNDTLNFLNRQIFIRNNNPIYICPNIFGWTLTSHNLFEELQDKNTLQFTTKTTLGIYQLKCGDQEIVVEIIDSLIVNIVLDPPFPCALPRDEHVIFRVIFQPFSINEDKTYRWSAHQSGGDGKLGIETKNDLIVIHIGKLIPLGSYSIVISLEMKIRTITFNITKEDIKQRTKIDVMDKRDTVDSLKGFNKFFLSLIILGFIVSVLSTFVYICAITCTERNRMADISGHKNLIVEEELLMEDTDKQCYKVMENPMSREKDVEMILEKAREMQKEFSKIRPDIPGSMSKELTYQSFLHNPYGLSENQMKLLQEKFPEGVCLNCVKLASQILLLNKEDCPGVHHVCNDESCANHGQIRCPCAELQTNAAAPRTYNLYNAITSVQKCCQFKGKNNNNVNDSHRSRPKYIENGYWYREPIHSPNNLEERGFENVRADLPKLKDGVKLQVDSSGVMCNLANSKKSKEHHDHRCQSPTMCQSSTDLPGCKYCTNEALQVLLDLVKDTSTSQCDLSSSWMPIEKSVDGIEGPYMNHECDSRTIKDKQDDSPSSSTDNVFQQHSFPMEPRNEKINHNHCQHPCKHVCRHKSISNNICTCRCCSKKRI